MIKLNYVNKSKFKTVFVEWVDSTLYTNWDSLKKNFTTEDIVSVGIVISETDKAIIIAQSVSKTKKGKSIV